MVKRFLAVTALLVGLSGLPVTGGGQDAKPPASPAAPIPDTKTLLANVAKAMGSENLKTIRYSGTGSHAGLGQNWDPNTDPLVFMKSYTRDYDLIGPASRVKLVRVDEGREETQDQTILPTSPWDQQFDLWLCPFGFLKGAAANNATVEARTVGGDRILVATFTMQNKYKVSGYVDDKNLLRRVESFVDNPVFGDMPVEADYQDYQDFNGLKFPSIIVNRQGGHKTLILVVNDVKMNAAVDIGQSEVPAAARASQPAVVKSQKIVDGVFYLTGGTLHSVAVEFADHVAVIEAPENEQRSLAVIREVKKLTHNKPIRYVINTHAHFDHAGGLRTYVDEGATIITQELNKATLETMMVAPRTLNPDRLASSKKAATIETVLDRVVLGDKTRTLELDFVKDSPHSDGMLIAYLAKEKILIEADLFTPPGRAPGSTEVNYRAENLVENLERLKLDVDRILPLQGPGIATKADLYKAAGKDKAAGN